MHEVLDIPRRPLVVGRQCLRVQCAIISSSCITHIYCLHFYYIEYVNPGVSIPDEVKSLCNLTRRDLRAIEDAENWSDIGERFNQWIKSEKDTGGYDSVILVSYNGHKYDDVLIRLEGALHGLPDLSDIFQSLASLDVMKLVQDDDISWPRGRPTRFSLEGIYNYVTGSKMKGAHNAMADVKAMCTIIDNLDPNLVIGENHIFPWGDDTSTMSDERRQLRECKNVLCIHWLYFSFLSFR